MRPDLAALERLAESDGPLHRIDARIKIVATLVVVVAVVATPPGLPWELAIEAATLARDRRHLARPDPLHPHPMARVPRPGRVPGGDGRAGASGSGPARLVGRLGRDPGEEQPGVRRRPDARRDHADASPARRPREARDARDPRLDAPFHDPIPARPGRRTGPDDPGATVQDVPPLGTARLGPAHGADRHAARPLVRAWRAGPRGDARPGVGRDDPHAGCGGARVSSVASHDPPPTLPSPSRGEGKDLGGGPEEKPSPLQGEGRVGGGRA